jgi:hypothetical protein
MSVERRFIATPIKVKTDPTITKTAVEHPSDAR